MTLRLPGYQRIKRNWRKYYALAKFRQITPVAKSWSTFCELGSTFPSKDKYSNIEDIYQSWTLGVQIDNLKETQKESRLFDLRSSMLTLSAEQASREVYECGAFDEANISDFILNSEGVHQRNVILCALLNNFREITYCPILPSLITYLLIYTDRVEQVFEHACIILNSTRNIIEINRRETEVFFVA